MKFRILPGCIMAITCFCGSVLAASDSSFEEVLVTGSYAPQAQLTNTVSVLSQARIEALGKRTVVGLLRTLPGVLVEEQGGPGGLSAVSIRGGEANFTLVLLDGIPVNDPTNSRGGGYDFSNLSAALVERIEVVSGAQSAIYGSDALAGVINIITRQPVTGAAQDVYAHWGEKGYANYGVAAAGTAENFNYTLQLDERRDGRRQEGSRRENSSAHLRLGWTGGEGTKVTASYRYLEGDRLSYPEQSGGPELAVLDDLDGSEYEQQTMALSWEQAVSKRWRSALRANRFEFEESMRSPGISPFFEVPPNVSDSDFTRDQLQWVNTLRINDRVATNIGVDYRAEQGHSRGYIEFFGLRNPTDFELDRSTVGAFVAFTASPVDRLLFQGSARYDDPDSSASQVSAAIGAKLILSDAFTVNVNWGNAYKLPSFFALGHGLVGNPALLPEESKSWDIGVGWAPIANFGITGTVFFNDFRDLVDLDDATFRNVNRGQVETSGVELQSHWQAGSALQLQAQVTYTDLDVEEDTVLTGRPRWTAGLSAQWQLSQQLSSTLDYRYGGEQWAASRHTGLETTQKLDDYHRVDWVLQFQWQREWRWQLMVDNLFNEDYATAVGFTAPDRALRIGVRYSGES